MLNFNWKFLTPTAIAVLLVTALTDKLVENAQPALQVVVLLAVNIIMLIVIVAVLRNYAVIERERVGEEIHYAQPATRTQVHSTD